MQPAVAGRLREAGDAELVEQRLELPGGRARLGEAGARLRVEVEAQLVGVLGVVGAVRPDVEAQAGEVDRPGDVRDVGRHERPRRRAVDGLHGRRLAATPARSSGTRFWKNDGPPAPCGKRCMSTGRPPIARISGSATAA